MPKVDVYRRGARQISVAIGPQGVTLGRGADAEVRLDDKLVSRHHARIIPGDGGWVVEDLKTRNGTHVNGLKEFRRSLKTGDRIEVGPFVLLFSKEGPATAQATSPKAPAVPATDLSWASPAPQLEDDEEILELDSPLPTPARSKEEATSLAAPKELAKLRADGRARLQPHLIHLAGPQEVVHALREGETLVGRGDRCHVRVPAARRQIAASVVKTSEGFELRKRAWFFSMKVNDEKTSRRQLAPGDRIELGEAVFVFQPGA